MKAGSHLPLHPFCINAFFSHFPKPLKSLGVSREGADACRTTGSYIPWNRDGAALGPPTREKRHQKSRGVPNTDRGHTTPPSNCCLGYTCLKAAKARTQAPLRVFALPVSLQRGFLGGGKTSRTAHQSRVCRMQHGQPGCAAVSFFPSPSCYNPGWFI